MSSKETNRNDSLRCPVCRAANSADARYCEQCGAVLGTSARASGNQPPAVMRYLPLLLIASVLVLVLVGWIVRSSRGPVAGDTAAQNVHGVPDDGSGQAGDVRELAQQYEQRLAGEPLDTDALNQLYILFGSIGEADRVTPFAKAAVESWLRQPADSREIKRISDVAALAYQHGDLLGAVAGFEAYSQAEPENLPVLATIGDLHLRLSRLEAAGSELAGREARKAETWYGKYLAQADPATDSELYWSVLVNQASARIAQLPAEGADFAPVLADLQRATEEAPQFWLGWHSYGLALQLAGRSEDAALALQSAKQCGSPREAWESEQQLALIEGREPDPGDYDPTDPHGGMEMGGSGSDSPHGQPNPHGVGSGQENPHTVGTQG
ncbi:MAG: zinc ribbon domain-containing protein [bacterium]